MPRSPPGSSRRPPSRRRGRTTRRLTRPSLRGGGRVGRQGSRSVPARADGPGASPEGHRRGRVSRRDGKRNGSSPPVGSRSTGGSRHLGESVEPGGAVIAVDGRPVGEASAPVHLVANKPIGVTSTTRDRHAATTVLDLVPRALAGAGRLYPVGRLDLDSEGLILLTNDGAWADRVLHPRFGVEREYAIGLPEPADPRPGGDARGGIRLDEGLATLEPSPADDRRPRSAASSTSSVRRRRRPRLVSGDAPPRAGSASSAGCSPPSGRRSSGSSGSASGPSGSARSAVGAVRPLSAAEVRSLGAGRVSRPMTDQRPRRPARPSAACWIVVASTGRRRRARAASARRPPASSATASATPACSTGR